MRAFIEKKLIWNLKKLAIKLIEKCWTNRNILLCVICPDKIDGFLIFDQNSCATETTPSAAAGQKMESAKTRTADSAQF